MRLNQKISNTSNNQSGMTLVELMVAMTLSLVILAGVIQVFISSKKSYLMNDALSRVQENGRFAVNFLVQDIRMAGFTGCYSGDAASVENVLNDQNNYGWDLNNMVYGNNDNGVSWSPALNAALSGLKAGTDTITIRHLAGNGIELTSPYNTGAQLFVGDSGSSLVEGSVLMVTDCSQASIFQLTNLQATGGGYNVVHSSAGGYTPGNSTPIMSNSYAEGAQVAALVTSAYYIKDNASGIPALYRSTLSSTAGATSLLSEQELVEGVEDMQILYGVDTDSDANKVANIYYPASTVDTTSNWDNVVNIRVSLLLRTIENNVASTEINYFYNGSDNTPTTGDKRLRRVFTTTINIRNRSL